MTVVEIDASAWRTADDLWDALLATLGAPDWHGRNLNALWDTVANEAEVSPEQAINRLRPPFRIRIRATGSLAPGLSDLLDQIQALFVEARRAVGAQVHLSHCPMRH